MMDSDDATGVSRRRLIQTALVAASLPAITRGASAQTRQVTTVQGFETTADVAKAEAEGEILFYTHDSDPAGAALMEAFSKDFPKIKGLYLRAQTGALYSKLLAERSAGRYAVDVVQFSEIGTALDFQKKGGYERYMSPQAAAFKPENLSSPAGDYFHAGVTFAGISYNSDKVSADEAPKNWKDVLDPRWRNAISTKQSTSGIQFVQWYELKRLYGDGFWKEFAKQRPRGFDSRAQLFDRLAKGDDKVSACAEWGGYQLVKERGAKVTFVAPPDGMPATITAAGIVDKAPHPEAARLFLDWLMSLRGQGIYQSNSLFLYPSLRKDAPAMPGGQRLSDFKLLFPQDIEAFTGSHATFVKEWNGMMGL
jgi:iron(III) transport system substrate-binding protein